jgi:uncharacterized membrane protein
VTVALNKYISDTLEISLAEYFVVGCRLLLSFVPFPQRFNWFHSEHLDELMLLVHV